MNAIARTLNPCRTVKIRRFEMGASGCGFDEFLQQLGYRIASNGSAGYRYWAPGTNKPKMTSKAGLMALLDRERIAKGLEPVMKRHLDHKPR